MAKNDPLFKGTPQSVQDLRKSAKRRERDKKRAAFFKAVTKGEQ